MARWNQADQDSIWRARTAAEACAATLSAPRSRAAVMRMWALRPQRRPQGVATRGPVTPQEAAAARVFERVRALARANRQRVEADRLLDLMRADWPTWQAWAEEETP